MLFMDLVTLNTSYESCLNCLSIIQNTAKVLRYHVTVNKYFIVYWRNRASDGVGVAMYPVPSSGSNTLRIPSVRYVSVMKYMLAIILIMVTYKNKPKITLNVKFEQIFYMK